MRQFKWLAWFTLIIAPLVTGCKGGTVAPGGQKTVWQQNPNQQPYEAQIADLTGRARKLDADNNELQAAVAQAQKQSQVFKDQLALTKRQLEDATALNKDLQLAKQEAEKKAESLQASVQQRGGAIITANNSVKQSLAAVSIPGIEVRQDGDVVRIDVPADQLFRPGTNQLQQTAFQVLDPIADAITRNYSKHRVGIEAHTDGVPTAGGYAYTDHQLSTAQALAIFDQLTQRNRLPAAQFFTVGHGANHPRVPSPGLEGRVRNRRLEFVIYPETTDRK